MNWKSGLCVLGAAVVVAGCGDSKDSTGGATDVSGGSPATSLKQAPTGEGTVSGNVAVAAFDGGYHLDFYEKAAQEYQAKTKGVTVKVTGSPDVADQIRTNMLAGTPPDLMYPSWKYDLWNAAGEGQLFLLDKALDSPAYGSTTPWRDTFEPAILKIGQDNGHQYVFPFFFSIWGWWFDPGVFAKNGWQPPKTYEELLALCEKIKAKGMAPITFAGKYPYYMLQGMVLPWVQDIGGMQVINDIQNLVPGAWKNPAVLQAVGMIKELKDKGDFQEGAVGLTHTESQTQFLQGKAAMIPCGTWLDSEMKESKPANAKMQFLMQPMVKDGRGDASSLCIEIEPWMVPADAKNPNGAIAFYKYMTSLPKAKEFVQQKATLMAIKGSDQVTLPETLQVPAKLFKASKSVYSFQAREWYTAMEKDIEDGLTSLLNGQLTPEQFCDRAEAAAQKTRDDKGILKHKL